MIAFADEGNVLPIMSVGDFNLTKKGFSKALKKHSTILVVGEGYMCDCI